MNVSKPPKTGRMQRPGARRANGFDLAGGASGGAAGLPPEDVWPATAMQRYLTATRAGRTTAVAALRSSRLAAAMSGLEFTRVGHACNESRGRCRLSLEPV